jgi:hypothetical protein
MRAVDGLLAAAVIVLIVLSTAEYLQISSLQNQVSALQARVGSIPDNSGQISQLEQQISELHSAINSARSSGSHVASFAVDSVCISVSPRCDHNGTAVFEIKVRNDGNVTIPAGLLYADLGINGSTSRPLLFNLTISSLAPGSNGTMTLASWQQVLISGSSVPFKTGDLLSVGVCGSPSFPCRLTHTKVQG